MQARPYSEADAERWDAFCADAYMATFLHSRRFLAYHGTRFRDLSVVLEHKGDWWGVLPAAEHPEDPRCVVSHPGITYGGLLHQGKLRGQRMLDAFDAVKTYYKADGLEKLLYKPVPHIYHRALSQDDLYAMFRLQAARTRCDISCAIDLHNRLPISQRRKRALKKADKAGAQAVVADAGQIEELWQVLEENLMRKHGVTPVHSLAEITGLATRFPGNIEFVVGLLNDRVEAGVVLFRTPFTCHAQYIAASPCANEAALLDGVFEYSIGMAIEAGVRYFDFGISNEDQGRVLNQGLFSFKSEFGGGGVVHEFYEINLN